MYVIYAIMHIHMTYIMMLICYCYRFHTQYLVIAWVWVWAGYWVPPLQPKARTVLSNSNKHNTIIYNEYECE